MTSDNVIFRFKFSDEFANQLYPFAKLHQYDDRHTYKEEWTRWLMNNDELIDTEVGRLKGLGYDGDIIGKMYKSGRYYFRKKTSSKDAKVRRKYISLEHDMIDAMDEHINTNYYLPCFKPSIAYEQFCMEYENLVNDETERLLQEELVAEDIYSKLKKTYKNRYFLFKQNRYAVREEDNCDAVYRQDTDMATTMATDTATDTMSVCRSIITEN
jgi:hypothetical protein